MFIQCCLKHHNLRVWGAAQQVRCRAFRAILANHIQHIIGNLITTACGTEKPVQRPYCITAAGQVRNPPIRHPETFQGGFYY